MQTDRSALAETGPLVDAGSITFRLDDADDGVTEVRLCQELVRPRCGLRFRRGGDGWRLTFPRLPVDRMEYKFELVRRDGSGDQICDPANPLRAPGPFGDKSVVEFPGYRPPAWLDNEGPRTQLVEHRVASSALRRPLRALLWAAPGTDPEEPLPLLVVHDGPEYADYSGLHLFLETMTAAGRLPPMRAAFLPPVDRNQHYSASAAYGRALALNALPALGRIAPTPHGRRVRVGMGASLGALAMAHAHRTYPASFGGLFLQSGSFFRQRFDKQEAGFVRFRRISRFVGTILTRHEWAHPIPVVMTCGTVEENLANNRAVRDALAVQGYEVSLVENRDAHNWVAWRDTFDPHLVGLLERLWG